MRRLRLAIVNQARDAITDSGEPTGSNISVSLALAHQLSDDLDICAYCARLSGQRQNARLENIAVHRIAFSAKKFHKGVELLCGRFLPESAYFASHWYHREYFLQVAAALRRAPVDIVIVQSTFQAGTLLRAAAPNASLVLHVHAEEICRIDPRYGAEQLRPYDGIVTVSDYITSKVKSRFSNIAIPARTIGNGVDTNRFRVRTERRRDACNKILFLGRVSPEKGPHILVEAYRKLRARGIDAEVDFAGHAGLLPLGHLRFLVDDDIRDTLMPYYGRTTVEWLQTELLGRGAAYVRAMLAAIPAEYRSGLRFHGHVAGAELHDLIESADVLVAPSVWDESYGLPVVEAAASALPVVASRCGGIPELVLDGVTGVLVEPRDPDALSSALEELLGNPSRLNEMASAARSHAVESLDWRNSARRLKEFIFSICST